MEEVIEVIPVRDTNGGELTLFEYQRFEPRFTVLGLLRGAGNKRLVLDTGEPVRRVNHDTFVIIATGEPLFRIMNPDVESPVDPSLSKLLADKC